MMRTSSRRNFLIVSGSVAAYGGRYAPAAEKPGEPQNGELQDGGTLQVARRSSRALGSHVSITALHPEKRIARQAIDAAFEALECVESVMSIYRPDSQISRLNRERALDDPHPYLYSVLEAASRFSERTSGAFDVTVQPLWDLYRKAQREGRLPTAPEVETLRPAIDWRQVHVRRNQVRLTGSRTQITLNGIAQGFAADLVMATLRNSGIANALVDTGELSSLGHALDRPNWKVGIQHPRSEKSYIALADLDDRCLATSGDYQTAFSQDLRHHHLFDPRTGSSPEELASVSVAARTAIEADALSTAVFVMGPEAGSRLIDATEGADVLVVTKAGKSLATDGFPLSES